MCMEMDAMPATVIPGGDAASGRPSRAVAGDVNSFR
jgi:hypothetical protein